MKTLNFFWKAIVAVLFVAAIQSCSTNSEDETTVIITVRDATSNAYIQGGTVNLYRNAHDFTYNTIYKSTNTDINGQATFTGVDAGYDYHFDAEQAGKTNAGYTYYLGTQTKPGQTSYASTYIH